LFFVLVHLGFWGQMGVMVRFWITTALEAFCKSDVSGKSEDCWSEDGTIREFVGTMLCNMIGSFLMGFLTENRAHLLWFEAPHLPLSFLPKDHPFQKFDALLTGLRVGFCGCLTTYATWGTQMVVLVSRGAILSLVLGFFTQMSVVLTCFVLGEHTAIGLHMLVDNKHRDRHERGKLWHKMYTNILLTDKKKNRPAHRDPIAIIHMDKGDKISIRRVQSNDKVTTESWDAHGTVALLSCNIRKAVEATAECPDPDQQVMRNSADSLLEMDSSEDGLIHREDLTSGNALRYRRTKQMVLSWNIFNAFMFFVFTALWAWLLAVDTDYIRRRCWISLLFSPLGCISRWKACRSLNGIMKGRSFRWFPLGTFSINVVATTITCIVLAIRNEFCISIYNMYWASIVMNGIETGFNGSLSTVSTFVSEVQKYMLEFPRNHKGWLYMSATFVSSTLIGFAVFSWSVYIPNRGPYC